MIRSSANGSPQNTDRTCRILIVAVLAMLLLPGPGGASELSNQESFFPGSTCRLVNSDVEEAGRGRKLPCAASLAATTEPAALKQQEQTIQAAPEV